MYTLVIVDMQSGFEAARCEKTVQNVIRQVEIAKRNWATIVVMEYESWGRYIDYNRMPFYGYTDHRIMDAIGDYKWQLRVVKQDDDGSDYLFYRAINVNMEYETHHFKVCGVNTGACVYSTVDGLKTMFPEARIDMLLNACNQPDHWDTWHTKSNLRDLKRNGVNLVGKKMFAVV